MRFDHVNIRTGRLDEMRRWYVEVLGLVDGPRPSFRFPGAWLYAGDVGVIHLVGVAQTPEADPDDLRIEHIAFAAGSDLEGFRARLDQHGVAARMAPVAGTSIVQVNIHDPDGNHVHVDFEV